MYFDKPYNRTIFLNLLQTKIFPNFERKEEHLSFGNKTVYFVENGIYRLGTINLDKEIAVLEIEQKSSNDPRITLTKDAFKILEHHGIDHAIIVFHCKDTSSYRLSLLTVTYENWEKKTSSYKRYSYILGPNEKVKTPEKELLHPVKDYEDLRNRFKVEVVRDQFFDEYLDLFVRLYKAIQSDKPFVELLESQSVDIVSFTKNLLGKIIFLYFIQKKGWLGLGRNTTTKYGEGNRDFMRILWNNFKNSNESMSTEKTGYFYNDYLEWLFFAGLNTDRRDNDDWFPNLQMKVPYLNGGLFKEEYTGWEAYITKIDNKIFSNYDEKGDDADGILDIFDRYNFTIDEDSLYDRDIAVDPEMLGRIFEKMISISNKNIDEVVKLYDEMKAKGKGKFDFGNKLNKDLGAFYTPREIVHYMTQECLSGYLQTKTKSTEEEISKLFELKEAFMLDRKELNESGFSGDFLKNIDEALKQVKVLDPAVGSGAYPMGLLHEISGLRYYLYGAFHSDFGDTIDEFKNEEGKISLYKIKKDIILNNIYGVDIDPGAIDIAKLRFWLSLVVDAQEPEPLPNFEFKFVCANSLISLADETKEKDLFSTGDEPKLETLKKYKRDFYNASSKQEKKELKNRIIEYTKIENTLFSQPTLRAKQIEEFGKNFDNPKHQHSFFDSSLMLSEWRGFDIVIGNPPYGVSIQGEYRDSVVKFLGKVPDYEIYYYFIEKARLLLKEGGTLSYIIPNTWLFNTFAAKYRIRLFDFRKLKEVLDCSSFPIFESATVRNSIIYFTKSNLNSDEIGYKPTANSDSFDSLIGEKTEIIQKDSLLKLNQNWGLAFKLPGKIIDIVNKILSVNGEINDFYDVSQGYIPYRLSDLKKTYGDIEGEKIKNNRLWHSKNKSDEFWVQEIYGKDISKYYFKPTGDFVKYGKHVGTYVDMKFFNQKRLLVREITNPCIIACIVDETLINDPQLLPVIPKNNGGSVELLWGILNSKLATFYHFNHSPKATKGAFPKILVQDIKKFPLSLDNTDLISRIERLVIEMLQIKKSNMNCNIQNKEKELNLMVYNLYGLADEEIQIVEDSIK